MPMILGILAVLVAIGVWAWRLQAAKRGLDSAAEIA